MKYYTCDKSAKHAMLCFQNAKSVLNKLSGPSIFHKMTEAISNHLFNYGESFIFVFSIGGGGGGGEETCLFWKIYMYVFTSRIH